jgi:hypothetical protein
MANGSNFMGLPSQQQQQQPRPQQAPQTFSQMQQQGIARPPKPPAQPPNMYQQPYYPQAPAPYQQQQQPTTQPAQQGVQPQQSQQHAQPMAPQAPMAPPQQYAPPQPPQVGQPGQAGQQPMQYTPQQTSPYGPAGQQMEQFSQGWLANPNPYNADVANQVFNAMNQRITEQYDQANKGLNADFASRGLYTSTPAAQGNELLRGYQAQAQSQLASDISQQAAMTDAQGRQQALQGALGVGQQGFGNQLSQNYFNLAQQQEQDQLMMALLGATGGTSY